MTTRNTGILWENAALAHLRANGLHPLARNYTCRYGEIDLIMKGSDSIVFVEVRYRKDGAHGDGIASVGAGKRAKLTRAAALWLQGHPQYAVQPCRFDVVGCSVTPDHPTFDWTRNAFDAV